MSIALFQLMVYLETEMEFINSRNFTEKIPKKERKMDGSDGSAQSRQGANKSMLPLSNNNL
jgi:hypothetical protein